MSRGADRCCMCHVGIDAFAEFLGRVVLVDIDVIIFEGTKESLGSDVVQGLPLSVYGDTDAVTLKQLNVLRIGKMVILIAVDDLEGFTTELTLEAGHNKSLVQGTG